MVAPLPDYKNLDLSGEVQQAAARLEARAREAASQEMFQQLVTPLLTPRIRSVFEFGCGTAALARRIAQAARQAVVYASDKSAGLLAVARRLVEAEDIPNLRLQPWDVLDESAFPFPDQPFDLILSSVVIPYFDDSQTIDLIERLVARLAPGGILAFVEQDWASDSVHFPRFELFKQVLGKEQRAPKRTLALGLRRVLRAAGLQVVPRRSFLWTDDAYGAYTRDLLERFADAAADQGQIKPEEREEWRSTLNAMAEAGDFYYGIVYHLVAGRREYSIGKELARRRKT